MVLDTEPQPDVRPFGPVIVLHGVSSSGKSTLARRLQELTPHPLFHLAQDTFRPMLEPRFIEDNNRPFEQRLQAMNSVIHALHVSARSISGAGHPVVIDTVFDLPEWLLDCVRTLDDRPTIYVGVHCPSEELVRQERERGDRRIGVALEQLDLVHKAALYDVEVDTHAEALDECARRILDAVARCDSATAGRRMLARFHGGGIG